MSGVAKDEWFVRSRGKVLGPFALRQLEILRNQGRLAKFDEVSQGDRRSWVVASTLPELFPSAIPSEVVGEPPSAETSYSVESTPPKADAANWHYMGPQGASAPVPVTELLRLANTGVVTPDTPVWTAELTDWTPARNVPLLGLSRPPTPSATSVSDFQVAAVAVPVVVQPPGVGTGFSTAGFVLGFLGFLGTGVVYLLLIPALLSAGARTATGRSSGAIAFIYLGFMIASTLSSLLSVTFATIGMVKAARDEKRRGFGLGIAGLILALLALTGLAVMVLLVVLGIVAVEK